MTNNQLQINTPGHALREGKLVCYYKDGNNIEAQYNIVSTTAVVMDDHQSTKILSSNFSAQEIIIEFNQAIDPTKTLIIDPPLEWATLYGGANDWDDPMDIVTDKDDNIYICGATYSADFPTKNDVDFYRGTFEGESEAFIMKFDSITTLLWTTFYGGINSEWANSIAINSEEFFYVAGFSGSGDLPMVTGSGFNQSANAGLSDAFILKFDSEGIIQWSTFYGGELNDVARSIAVDNQDNIVIIGTTKSHFFPTFQGGGYIQDEYGGGFNDAFLIKFNSNEELIWATYYGGSGYDYANSIAFNNNNEMYIVGETYSPDFSTFRGDHQFFNDTKVDAEGYILKFSPLGKRLWATYLGGNGNEDGAYSIVIDKDDNMIVAGNTRSTNFPVKNAIQPINGGGLLDAFIIKFNPIGEILWGTYLGGSLRDYFRTDNDNSNIILDDCNNLFLSFANESQNMILKRPSDEIYFDDFNDTTLGASDLYLAKISENGKLLWGSYFGGNIFEFRGSLAIDKKNHLYLTGEWGQGDTSYFLPSTYPITQYKTGYLDSTFNGIEDIFIARFKLPKADFSFMIEDTSLTCIGDTTTLMGSGGDQYIWSTGDTAMQISISPEATQTYSVIITDTIAECSENFSTIIEVINANECTDSFSIFIPNVIVSNGTNTSFAPIISGQYNSYILSIYDRFGKLIYTTTNPSERWQGKYANGQFVQQGVYIYKVIVNEVKMYSGNVTLLR